MLYCKSPGESDIELCFFLTAITDSLLLIKHSCGLRPSKSLKAAKILIFSQKKRPKMGFFVCVCGFKLFRFERKKVDYNGKVKETSFPLISL